MTNTPSASDQAQHKRALDASAPPLLDPQQAAPSLETTQSDSHPMPDPSKASAAKKEPKGKKNKGASAKSKAVLSSNNPLAPHTELASSAIPSKILQQLSPPLWASDDPVHAPRPLFEDPSARALARVGVVDVGSNSVRMVVFDGAARSPAYFYNEKLMAGLGKNLAETGKLNPQGKARALVALKRFSLLAKGMGVAQLICVATAAVREAEDGPAFQAQVERETGLTLRIVDGNEEARLSAQGVLLGWPEARGIVCDIGGNSMELARIGGGKVGQRATSPLGPFRLQQISGGPEKRRAVIDRVLRRLRNEIKPNHDRIYLVGGSWRVIARLDMERRNYPLTVLHEYRMTPKSVLETIDWIASNDPAILRARTGTSAERMELVPLACEVLRELIRIFQPEGIDISSYGIREGLLYEQMPDRLRARDPLLEAARAAEQSSARFPGFGKKLYNFLQPLFEGQDAARLRLIKAACLLHDVSWRAHPDYRAEVCFDNATRANLGGLDHEGRVYLGLALLHRYKNQRPAGRSDLPFRLLSDDDQRQAEVLGKAMRFGAMFSATGPEAAASLRWMPKKKVLTLQLSLLGEGLYGEVSAARLRSLGAALGAKVKVLAADGSTHKISFQQDGKPSDDAE